MTRTAGIDIGAAVPGALLPVMASAVAIAAGTALGVPAAWIGLIGAAALVGGIVRVTGGVWIAAGVVFVSLLSADPAPWRTAVAVAAVHLLHVLGSLMLVVPMRSRVTLAALRPTAVRFVIVQSVCQAAGLLASMLSGRSGLPGAIVAGSLAVLAFAVIMVGRLRAQRRTAFPRAMRGASQATPPGGHAR